MREPGHAARVGEPSGTAWHGARGRGPSGSPTRPSTTRSSGGFAVRNTERRRASLAPPGDSRAAAQSIVANAPLTDTIASVADTNWYKVEVPHPDSVLTITLSGLMADYDLYLFAPEVDEESGRASGIEGFTWMPGANWPGETLRRGEE